MYVIKTSMSAGFLKRNANVRLKLYKLLNDSCMIKLRLLRASVLLIRPDSTYFEGFYEPVLIIRLESRTFTRE